MGALCLVWMGLRVGSAGLGWEGVGRRGVEGGGAGVTNSGGGGREASFDEGLEFVAMATELSASWLCSSD